MSGDTILTIIAVSLTVIFISVLPSSAIECGSCTGHPGGGKWRSEPGLAVGNTEGGSRGAGAQNLHWFWSLTVNGPMMQRSDRMATLEEAKVQFQNSWGTRRQSLEELSTRCSKTRGDPTKESAMSQPVVRAWIMRANAFGSLDCSTIYIFAKSF
jgi:hypothetical protein